ncbi:carbonic anhydrase 4-like isoform X2 [Hoplias malabaricus]|uniref:carbonic anhydrase 4-like isoform X2 n=1 Tax=Hoplias malabaricus TaxID=27720 RepID=UPI0034623B17
MVLWLFWGCFAVWSFSVTGADPSVGWCYNLASCNESTWPSIVSAYCNGSLQSPIDIVTADVVPNGNLTELDLTGFNDGTALTRIKNTGRGVEVTLNHGNVSVEGADLPDVYNTRQLHLHWGKGRSEPGSEHTVDGKRYAMELHIVNVKTEYNSTAAALTDPTGLAVFGFFIEATNDTGKPDSWKTLTSYLSNISNAGDVVALTPSLSVDSLLEGVDMSRYYRYLGSLTIPNCNEAVVWTVFKDPIRVSADLVDLFSTSLYFNQSFSLMTDIFRQPQPLNGRVVTSQVAARRANISPKSDATRPPFSVCFVPVLLYIALFGL